MSTQLPEVIIFDIGNVLIDVDHLTIGIGLAETSRHTSYRDRAVLLSSIREWRSSPLIAEFEEGRLSAENFYARMKDAYALQATFEEFRNIWNSGFTENKQVLRLIGLLRGRTRLLALSNTDPLHFEYISRTYPVLGWMEETIVSFRVGKRKPAAEMFTAALTRARVPPSQAWYVDDLQDFVDAAEKMGMRGIRYRTAPELADALGVA